ncbi:unnamed protein product [Pedinophyceae sp. YPF-701]|nr:unnamed protein product [Pedinophyceae sp. YPF-701]
MTDGFVSRHHLGCIPSALRLLPAASAGPTGPDGTALRHQMILIGGYDPQQESESLNLFNLTTANAPDGTVRTATLELVSDLAHTGAVECLDAALIGPADDVLVVSGSSRGRLHALSIGVSFAPGAGPDQGTLHSYDDVGVHAHKSAVADVSINKQTRQVATVGRDGAAHVYNVDPSGGGLMRATTFAGPGCGSFTAVQWAGHHELVSASSAGGLQVWDTREGLERRITSPDDWHNQAGLGHIRDLHVHPARPAECAAAGSTGAVSLWDLRFAHKPLACPPDAGDEATAVRLAGRAGGGGLGTLVPSPMIAATASGAVVLVGPSGERDGQLAGSVLVEGGGLGCAVLGLDVGEPGALGQDVVAVNGGECLQYMRLPPGTPGM